jgi:hypothetical protein
MQEIAHTRRERRRAPRRCAARLATTRKNPKPPATEAKESRDDGSSIPPAALRPRLYRIFLAAIAYFLFYILKISKADYYASFEAKLN